MEDIAKKFNHLFNVISSEEFLKMESLGGEIPFFISTFNPNQQLEVNKAVKGLKNKLENIGIKVLELNLYDISMSIINREFEDEEIFELEKQMDKEEFKQALQSTLDLNEVLIPELKKIIESSNAKVYFLTGIGMVFPFIRSHNVLNNLQNIAKDAPTVAFFPGDYNGQSLELFGLLKDENYYRAFNIDQYKVRK
ncbi:MAG: DUF1788 domain-containing protein [Bacteroidales bacterium]|nr:DUF1788 domain-containing protein [Bacteroidales bacterium]MCF8336431.1 DUF1788 domain-containing protein [Bacteroidales bacterium]